jgi:hypothetical protein
MATLKNLSAEETSQLQMHCVAYASGDFEVPVGNPAVRAFMVWDYVHDEHDGAENPIGVEVVEEWVERQQPHTESAKMLSESLHALQPVDPAPDYVPEWRFQDWATVLVVPWAEDLDAAVIDASEWMMDG